MADGGRRMADARPLTGIVTIERISNLVLGG
jgi:hypothetical protein